MTCAPLTMDDCIIDSVAVVLHYIVNSDRYVITYTCTQGYNSKKEFIACQGPLESTQSDFWRMVWEQKSHYIVMLTKLKERGKVGHRISTYERA